MPLSHIEFSLKHISLERQGAPNGCLATEYKILLHKFYCNIFFIILIKTMINKFSCKQQTKMYLLSNNI